MNKLIAILALAILLPTAASAQEASRSSTWDIKGIRLGMTQEEAVAALPGLSCKEWSPGISSCNAKKVPFAGGQADIGVNLLDGKVVNVVAHSLTIAQLLQANDGLSVKFGTPDVRNGLYVRQSRDKVHNLAWKDGERVLYTLPDGDDTSDRPVRVVLRDKQGNNAWKQRDDKASNPQLATDL